MMEQTYTSNINLTDWLPQNPFNKIGDILKKKSR